jgi:signal-transduction protein with cAMP-binding, CBS, and nucleotidyltransferase domain
MKPLLFRDTIQKIKINEYETKRNSIEQVDIFEGLSNKQKLNLANALKIMIYQKGERILIKNELANAFYIINEGKVTVEL